MTRPHRQYILLLIVVAAFMWTDETRAAPSPYPSEFTSEVEATGVPPGAPPIKPVPPRRHEPKERQTIPVVRRVLDHTDSGPVCLSGALSGKSVYLSPGHGWTYTSSNNWHTQRPNTHGVVEDLSNVDGLAQFLVPYLLNAGALVVPVKEIDPTPQMVILDNGDGAKDPQRGTYTEVGPASEFSDSTLKGWGHPPLPLTGSKNPFEEGGNRLMKSSGSADKETARAVFVPNVPESNYYNVYISYSMYKSRASDARVIVAHPGGQTHFLVDQRRHGGTWVLLGRFYFDKGANESSGAVIFSNRSADVGSEISMDAVRLGGGMGLIDRGGGTSGQRRTDECCRYHAQFAGAPANDVYDHSGGDDRTDDVSSRSRFADWVHAPGEPAVYISHHTNAAGGRGTESYIYGKNPVDGKYVPTPETLALGSDKLCKAVHDEILADIHAVWDPNWQDRGIFSAYFGELNTANQDEMASMLLETAFHDNQQDAGALKEAEFRRIVGRAIYKGVVKYFAALDGSPVHLLPEPPREVRAINTAPGEVTVSWQPPPSGGALGDPAATYRVYTSKGGYAFDEGIDTGGKTTLTLKKLSQGHVVYIQVRAVNDGGRSLPSPALAVGVAWSSEVPLLLVTAFDRFDAEMNLKIDYPKVNTADRLWVEQINHGTYLVQHGQALAPSRVPFDAADHTAVDQGAVKLDRYQMVIWQGGKGLQGKLALTDGCRDALEKAAAAGVSLVMSGSTLARFLGSGSTEEQTFLDSVLHAGFEAATQPFTSVTPSTAGALEGLSPWDLSTYKTGPYETGIPDVITPKTGGKVAATYTGSGSAAAIQFKGGGRCSVLLGFPLETALPEDRQGEILGRLLELCELKVPPIPDGGLPDAYGDGGLPPPFGDGGIGDDDDGCGCFISSAPRQKRIAPLCLLALTITGLLLGLSRSRRRR